jgi:SpoVK/Ycf46/Vps4 family AAA+-type ATPase
MNELEVLEQKEFIHIYRGDEDFSNGWQNEKIAFELRFKVIDELSKGYCPELFSVDNLSIDGFFAQLEHLCKERVQSRQSYKNCIEKMKKLLNGNEQLVFVQKIKKCMLTNDDTLVLLQFFHYLVNFDEPEMGYDNLKALYDKSNDFIPVKRQLRNGTYSLLKKELIESTCSDGFSDSDTFRLTDTVKDEFLIELDSALLSMPVKNLKRAGSITIKHLFYPEKTQQAINELASLLQPDHFCDVQKRLSENGMRTNLSANMDTAFERRFLYKIEFEMPEVETRKEIWRSIIGGLSDEEAGILASRFDFSGGQIENIARRSTVHRVLSGKPPVLEELIKLCKTELPGRNNVIKLGFTA